MGCLMKFCPSMTPLSPCSDGSIRNSNTIFNTNQMRPLVSELDRLAQALSNEDERALVAKIREIAVECQGKPQTYLRFIGD